MQIAVNANSFPQHSMQVLVNSSNLS